jgi:hypothetical protein
MLLFLLGKFSITISFTAVYVYTTELFPTELRHSMLGVCAMTGRIGSMVAPQTPLLVSNKHCHICDEYIFLDATLCALVEVADFYEERTASSTA